MMLQQNGTIFIVSSLLCMTVAVDFNHPAQFRAVKINDEMFDGFLAQEFISRKLAMAQYFQPHFLLCQCQIFPVFSCKSSEFFVVRQKSKPLPASPCHNH